jgi:hypothetical protein
MFNRSPAIKIIHFFLLFYFCILFPLQTTQRSRS